MKNTVHTLSCWNIPIKQQGCLVTSLFWNSNVFCSCNMNCSGCHMENGYMLIQYCALGKTRTFLVDIEYTKHCEQITLLHHGLMIVFICKMMQTVGVLTTDIFCCLWNWTSTIALPWNRIFHLYYSHIIFTLCNTAAYVMACSVPKPIKSHTGNVQIYL